MCGLEPLWAGQGQEWGSLQSGWALPGQRLFLRRAPSVTSASLVAGPVLTPCGLAYVDRSCLLPPCCAHVVLGLPGGSKARDPFLLTWAPPQSGALTLGLESGHWPRPFWRQLAPVRRGQSLAGLAFPAVRWLSGWDAGTLRAGVFDL